MQTFAQTKTPRLPSVEDGQVLRMVKVEFGTYEYDHKTIDKATITCEDGKQYETSSGVLLEQLRERENLINAEGLEAKVQKVKKYLTFV